MFDLNLISEPGIQKETSNANWSFLYKQSEPDMNEQSALNQLQAPSKHKNNWRQYAFVLLILGFIAVVSILKPPSTHVKPQWVLNQVIDLIVESVYMENLQLEEANFTTNQVKVTIYSEDFTAIQSLSQGYRMENNIPYEMYQKRRYSYLNLIFPWTGNERGGNIQTLQSMVKKTVFSNKISINHTEDLFEIQGKPSDIISFLLQMAENDQIQKYNFSVFQKKYGQFNLKVRLNLI